MEGVLRANLLSFRMRAGRNWTRSEQVRSLGLSRAAKDRRQGRSERLQDKILVPSFGFAATVNLQRDLPALVDCGI